MGKEKLKKSNEQKKVESTNNVKDNVSKNSDNYRDKPGIKNEIEQEENKNEYERERGNKIEKKGEYDNTMIEEVKDKDMDKDKEKLKEKMKENDKEKVSATNNIEKSVLRDIEISENGRDNTLEMESLVEIENNVEIVKENLVNILDESKDKNRDIFNNENRKGK